MNAPVQIDATRRHPRCHRTHPFDEGRVILAGLLEIYAARHDQSIQTVLYVIATLGRDDLDSAMGPDRARGGGNDNKLVAGFVGFSRTVATKIPPRGTRPMGPQTSQNSQPG